MTELILRRIWSRDTTGRLPWHRVAMVGVLVAAAVLDGWGLSQNGMGNPYYAAAVRSMLQSWHDFFFVSLDPGGFVSVDKPPLALWLQTLSAKLLGYGGLALMLPQAIAGVLAVLVLYLAVARQWGRWAGVLAALALAVCPVSVAVARDNNVDAVMVLWLVLSAWALLVGLELGRLRWLLVSAALVGVGFNTKMLAAYLVLPAFGLAYLLCARASLRARILHLAAAGAVVLVVTAAWIGAVDLTPAAQRPYVGSSQNNSAVSLATGYNGLNRILGLQRGPGSGGRFGPNTPGTPGESGRPAAPAGQPLSGYGGAGQLFGGGAGPLRLVTGAVATQWSWLLPLGVIGGLSALLAVGPWRRDARMGSLIVWGGWLATGLVVFSAASGIFHPYYLSELGPPLAALVGIGGTNLLRDLRARGWRWLLAAAALLSTAAFQFWLLRSTGQMQWLLPAAATAAVLGAAAALLRLRPRLGAAVMAVGLAAVLAAPAAWAATTLGHPDSGTMPAAGPTAGGRPGAADGFDGAGSVAEPARLVAYVSSQQRGERWVLATDSSMAASPLIIQTGAPVMAMGGFSGGDPILDDQKVARLVADGQVSFFLVPNGPGPVPRGVDGRIAQACSPVSPSLWGGQTSPGGPVSGGARFDRFGGRGLQLQLYDCRGRAAQLSGAAPKLSS